MKYSPDAYAAAFVKALREHPQKFANELIRNLVSALYSHGDEKYASRVLQLINERLVEEGGGKVVVIESAIKLTKKEESEIRVICNKYDHISFVINPDLIAGVRIRIGNELEYDNSFTRKLDALLV